MTAWVLCIVLCSAAMAEALGVNWGTQATHPLPPGTVVNVLKNNEISNVKLFDADAGTMSALAGTGIKVMTGIPNDMLPGLTDYSAAQAWVAANVSRYIFNGGVNIKYVAVGNEPFLQSYEGQFDGVTLPALQNIQNALNAAGIGGSIKATIPTNADVYNSAVPSAGQFRSDIAGVMTSIVQFLNENASPFTINIYPFLSLYNDPHFPLDYAFFDGAADPLVDGAITYTNVFDANFDTLVSALMAIGYGNIPIIVGEIGWPTDGDIHANGANAEKFYDGLLQRIVARTGTPLRPNQDIEMYLFSLVDEDAKSVEPGNFERHWGLLRYDGRPKFALDLSGQRRNVTLAAAQGVKYLPRQWCVLRPSGGGGNASKLGATVNYACSHSDCTSLGYGSSCNDLTASGNASYAFNMYFQVQNQQEESCDFQGLAGVTAEDPSTDQCEFIIEIASGSTAAGAALWRLLPALLAVAVLLLSVWVHI